MKCYIFKIIPLSASTSTISPVWRRFMTDGPSSSTTGITVWKESSDQIRRKQKGRKETYCKSLSPHESSKGKNK
ncbi:hypothetical protein DRJ04_04990 [Candidatus Aerophobetes bacterium]|uniref:Uncharacterized protein n=1 Tax=Aerophobetes bacterium TaxID=2030807 RepID=A0A662DFJ8_UNCAE|nr:MAG: hypothetical protein DRJ04_04990 [Candidatus Aerophobetes bacterium]